MLAQTRISLRECIATIKEKEEKIVLLQEELSKYKQEYGELSNDSSDEEPLEHSQNNAGYLDDTYLQRFCERNGIIIEKV